MNNLLNGNEYWHCLLDDEGGTSFNMMKQLGLNKLFGFNWHQPEHHGDVKGIGCFIMLNGMLQG